MREGEVLKVARVCICARRRTYDTFAAPPFGDVYQTEQIFL